MRWLGGRGGGLIRLIIRCVEGGGVMKRSKRRGVEWRMDGIAFDGAVEIYLDCISVHCGCLCGILML